MTSAFAAKTQQIHAPDQSIWTLVRDFITRGAPQQVSKENTAPISQMDHEAFLLDAINNGYVIEETGEHATVLPYTRTQLKAQVEMGGWVYVGSADEPDNANLQKSADLG